MRKTAVDGVHELARQDSRVVFIGSDLGAGTLTKMRDEFPDRYFMEGVAEQHIVGMAAGMAMEGFMPYINTIATFLTRRCFEQIAVDLCIHNLDVRLIASGGGLVYAPLGPTHQAIDDIAILRALPNMTIVAPADAHEMRMLMPLTLAHRGPLYIRLGKGGEPVLTGGTTNFAIGQAYVMRPGSEALIVTTGVMLHAALEGATLLAARGVDATVLHMPTIKPLDTANLMEWAGRARAVVTIEEHSIIGGLGSAVIETIAEAGFDAPKRFKRIGIPDVFADAYGSQASLLERFGLTSTQVAAQVVKLLER